MHELFARSNHDIAIAIHAHRRVVLIRKKLECYVSLPWSLLLYPVREAMRRRERYILNTLIRVEPKSDVDAKEKLFYLLAVLTAQVADINKSQIRTTISTLTAHKNALRPLISK